MNNSTALAIVKTYYAHWTNSNYKEAASLLDEHIQFEMPINHYTNKDAFMNAVQFTRENMCNIHLLLELGNETEAVLIYNFSFAAIEHLSIAEHFKVHNGKIVFIRHIHDTHDLRNSIMNKK